MKKFYFIILLLIPVFSSAQRCFSKKDEFTGKQIKIGMVSLIPFTDLAFPLVTISKIDTASFIGFTFQTVLTENNFIADKMLMLVKFENGTIKKFHADPKTKIIASLTGTTIGFEASLSSADLFYIKDYPISLIRISYQGDEDTGYDSKITKGKAGSIMRAVDCVL